MRILHWTPKKRSGALGLIEEGLHTLSEITQITNIPKETLKPLKKQNTSLNKVQLDHPSKLSLHHKRQIVFYITRTHT